ncbi:MAG: M1 family metallopeptidase [Luteibaculum sp.]
MQHLKALLSSIVFLFGILGALEAQHGYWQQGIKYDMEVELNTANHQIDGKQKAIYTNNSPETISEVFYHLYFNAFQPGSMMDVRSRTIEDADSRVEDRISKLQPNEIGYQQIQQLTQDGENLNFQVHETILHAKLAKPLAPGESTVLEMKYRSQVPVQIRRSGRDNAEGISYSMTQWYPKIAEYDEDGWHPNPYVAREFYGIWGDFDVSITTDKSLKIGGTGEIVSEKENIDGTKTWKFHAEKVHDFAWAADPDYIHDIKEGPNGLKIHFYYENEEDLIERWTWVQDKTVRLFEIMNETFGVYPYEKYSILQGGDGGMEYPQATLITGERSPTSLLGVIVHEVIHSWYQMILGTNESLYPWMDEGFTTFASSYVMNILMDKNDFNCHDGSLRSYVRLVDADKQEPLTTHADFYHTNFGYGVSSYSKGELFLWQLQYMLGDKIFFPAMRDYYNTWKFKHPDANDFLRIMEKNCDCILDWYKEGWINTTNTIDYGVKDIIEDGRKSIIVLERIGNMPMPLDIRVTLVTGEKKWYHIGNYHLFNSNIKREFEHPEAAALNKIDTSLKPWPWTHPEYRFTIDSKKDKIFRIEIDPFNGTSDVNRENNTYDQSIVLEPVFFQGN